MTLLKIALALALHSGCSWTKRDIALQGTFAVTLAADWAQTNGIIGKCQEANPILMNWDTCDTRVPTAFYFPATFLLHAVIVHYLPRDWRGVAQGLSIGVQGKQILNNYVDSLPASAPKE